MRARALCFSSWRTSFVSPTEFTWKFLSTGESERLLFACWGKKISAGLFQFDAMDAAGKLFYEYCARASEWVKMQ